MYVSMEALPGQHSAALPDEEEDDDDDAVGGAVWEAASWAFDMIKNIKFHTSSNNYILNQVSSHSGISTGF